MLFEDAACAIARLIIFIMLVVIAVSSTGCAMLRHDTQSDRAARAVRCWQGNSARDTRQHATVW